MTKKLVVVAAGAMLLLGLLFGRDACSYMRTSLGWVHQSVKDSVPLEFELQRARDMITNLDPEIQRAMHLIAKQEVEVSNLHNHMDEAKVQLGKNRQDIDTLVTDLEDGGSWYTYAGRDYTRQQVEGDLTRRFDRFKTKEATVNKLDQLLEARQRGLKAAREKLSEMQAAKRQLEVEVANLEARLELVKVAQAASDITFDDSQLSRTKDLVTDIRTRIDVAERLVNTDDSYVGQIPLDTPESRNILEEVTSHFNRDAESGHIVLSEKTGTE